MLPLLATALAELEAEPVPMNASDLPSA